jgi:tRNA A-37 threonylcarbamoyl transferase component Bud32
LVKRFKLIDELGEGAMGRVYLAEDTVLKRHVALKLLPSKHRDGRPNHRTERLVREARSCASLDHPNVTSVYEIDECGGVHYIAMELAEGGNLEKLVQMSGPMEVERACQLTAEAAEALAHAHQRGIIHRDVKPANLLLTRSGRCKVCDFGLALFEIEATSAENKTRCVGTPYFIAPEVAVGKGATEQSDIYSLGCTLWYLLTGRQPYSGTSAREVMRQHVNTPLPDLRKWRPDVPERLAAAIEQACAKDPLARYESANHFAKVLRTFTIATPGASRSAGGSAGSGSMQPVDEAGGSVMMLTQSGAMAPVSAAQLEAILPYGAQEGTRIHVPTAFLYAGIGTVAAVILIGLGVWMAKQNPHEPPAVQAGATPPAVAHTTPSAPVVAPPTPAAPPSAAPVVSKPAAPTPPVTPVAEDQTPSDASNDGMASAPAVNTGENALANGTLEKPQGADGKIDGWYIAARCQPHIHLMTDNGNTFLRMTNVDPKTTTHADQKIVLDPSWKSIMLSARTRASEFKRGRTSSGAVFSFQDVDGKTVGHVTTLEVTHNSDWTDQSEKVDIPAKAKMLYLQCVVSYARGTIDFDDVKAVPSN